MTSSGLEPATFWLVAQCLNHYSPQNKTVKEKIQTLHQFPHSPGLQCYIILQVHIESYINGLTNFKETSMKTTDFSQILLIGYTTNLHKMLNMIYAVQLILLTRVIVRKLI
jgi:hypothetical protein